MTSNFRITYESRANWIFSILILVLGAYQLSAAQASVDLKNGEYRAEINGISHWYRIAGAENKTVPLVIVHGGPGGNVYNFERFAGQGLEKFATVVYYEQRGSGRSAAPADPNAYSISLLVSDLEGLRQKLNLPQIIPLGFSFGGELALEYALAHPEHVTKLVLQCPTVDWERVDSVQNYGFQAISTAEDAKKIREEIDKIDSWQERNDKAWSIVKTPTVDRLLFHSQEVAELNRKMWEENKLKNTGLMYEALKKEYLTGDKLIDRARAEKAPTLVMVGLYDRNVGVDLIRDLAAVIPNSKLVLFENSAHFPDMEETEKYVQTVRDFIKQGK